MRLFQRPLYIGKGLRKLMWTSLLGFWEPQDSRYDCNYLQIMQGLTCISQTSWCSLQDAAMLAATEHPVPLGFAAEVGVNAYAQLSIPSLPEQVMFYVSNWYTVTTWLCITHRCWCYFTTSLALLGEENNQDHCKILCSRVLPFFWCGPSAGSVWTEPPTKRAKTQSSPGREAVPTSRCSGWSVAPGSKDGQQTSSSGQQAIRSEVGPYFQRCTSGICGGVSCSAIAETHWWVSTVEK